MRALSFEQVVVALGMIVLAFANHSARDVTTGTAYYIDGLGYLDVLDALLVAGGGLLLVLLAAGRLANQALFAILTLPLLAYIAFAVVYAWIGHGSKSPLVLHTVLYVLLLYRTWDRPKDGS